MRAIMIQLITAVCVSAVFGALIASLRTPQPANLKFHQVEMSLSSVEADGFRAMRLAPLVDVD
jgi:hypothetical protein